MSDTSTPWTVLEDAHKRVRELADKIFRENFPNRPSTWDDGYMHGMYRAAEELLHLADEQKGSR